jgi:hypothetical protein
MTILKFNDLKKKESIDLKIDIEHIISTQIYDQLILSKDKKTLIHCPKCFKGSLEIPTGVEIIGVEAFADCRELTSVNISESVRKIEMFAFRNCKTLSKISLLTEQSIAVSEDAFDLLLFENCILEVRLRTRNIYNNSNTWREFNYIIEKTRTAEVQYFKNKNSLKQVI